MGSFWQAKTKRSKADTLFSEYIRRRDKVCQYRVKCLGNQTDWKHELQCSHYFGRARYSVRFDPLNADAACMKCHSWVESTAEGKVWLREFKKQQLGDKHDLLELIANQPGTRDKTLHELYVKELLKTL